MPLFHFVKAMRQQTRRTRHKAAATFVEMYGGGSICEEAEKSKRSLNLDGLNAFDLRTLKPDGTPWNFCRRKDREEARKYIRQHKPDWIIGSPPCTSLSLEQGFELS
jgi:site-specific DNA-cytosine methylase